MTVRARSAAGQYGIWVELGTRQMTMSALFPGSSEPISSSSPIARAALMVTALRASSGVSPSSRQATVIANGNVFEALMDVVRVCSLGQVTTALFDVGGQYRRSM